MWMAGRMPDRIKFDTQPHATPQPKFSSHIFFRREDSREAPKFVPDDVIANITWGRAAKKKQDLVISTSAIGSKLSRISVHHKPDQSSPVVKTPSN
ncbi:hypothetical protein ACTXT7_011091 [Hymenolepis weldensis]